MQLKINELLKDLLKESKNNYIRVYVDTQDNHYEGNLLLTTLEDIEDDHITITECTSKKYRNLKTFLLKSSITAFSYRIDKIPFEK